MGSTLPQQAALASAVGFAAGFALHKFCFSSQSHTPGKVQAAAVAQTPPPEAAVAREPPPQQSARKKQLLLPEKPPQPPAQPVIEENTEQADSLQDILGDEIQACLSPGSNAICLLKALLKDNAGLAAKDKARIQYALGVFQGVTVPTVLASEVDTGEDETLDEDTREWLRANFTTLGGASDQKKRSLKAVGKATLFAMRLKRTATHQMETLPYEEEVKTRKAIEQHLAGAGRWDFDVWRLRELTRGRELQTLGWYVLEQHGLIQHFGLERPQLRNWLAHVESLYTDTAYHSATHAADVVAGVHFFLITAGAVKLVSKIEALALLLAAIIHDTGHDGLNNTYHKNALSERAVKFNDQSIQENFHVSLVFEHTLNDPTKNIFANFSVEQRAEVRQLLIKLVLDTDMSRHFSNMQAFQAAIAERGSDVEKWANATETVLCIILHLADISNPARPLDKAKKWAELVVEEFWAQGDKETAQGLPVSPNCGRGTELASSQIGFISYIVQPFFALVADMLPELRELVLPHLAANLDHWKKLQDPVKVTARRKSVVVREGSQSASPLAAAAATARANPPIREANE